MGTSFFLYFSLFVEKCYVHFLIHHSFGGYDNGMKVREFYSLFDWCFINAHLHSKGRLEE